MGDQKHCLFSSLSFRDLLSNLAQQTVKKKTELKLLVLILAKF